MELIKYHYQHISFMELGHLLTRSDLTYPKVSTKVYHDSFCQLGSRILLPWVIYFEAFYLHVVSSFSCIPVVCPELVLFLTPLQFVHWFCNLPKCIPLFFSCIFIYAAVILLASLALILTTGKSHGLIKYSYFHSFNDNYALQSFCGLPFFNYRISTLKKRLFLPKGPSI